MILLANATFSEQLIGLKGLTWAHIMASPREIQDSLSSNSYTGPCKYTILGKNGTDGKVSKNGTQTPQPPL